MQELTGTKNTLVSILMLKYMPNKLLQVAAVYVPFCVWPAAIIAQKSTKTAAQLSKTFSRPLAAHDLKEWIKWAMRVRWVIKRWGGAVS